ncbi:MAG: adenosine deaminase [Pseudomonadota bacterium]
MPGSHFTQPSTIRKPSDAEIPDLDWLRRVPKTDLHCHLGGGIRLSTILDEAKRQGIKLKAWDKVRQERVEIDVKNEDDLRPYVVKNHAESLVDYLDAFPITESVMKDEQVLERVAYELCEDAFAENVRLLEIRYAPTNYRTPSLRLFEIVEAVLAGIERAREDFDMLAGLILCGMKQDEESIEEVVRLTGQYKGRGVIGFDLAGPERGFKTKKYEKLLESVFMSFVPVTIHAGEAFGAKSIAEAVIYLNARRIGHATNLFELSGLADYVEITGLGLEVCLSSNLHTRAIPSIQSHPVRQMMHRGLRFSLNTDNRTVSDTNITREMQLAVSELGFNKGAIIKSVKDGVKSSFFHKAEKRWVLDRIDADLAALDLA